MDTRNYSEVEKALLFVRRRFQSKVEKRHFGSVTSVGKVIFLSGGVVGLSI